MATNGKVKGKDFETLSPSERSHFAWEVVRALQQAGLINNPDEDKARAAAKALKVPFLSIWAPAIAEFDEEDLGEWSRARWETAAGKEA